MLHTLGGVWKAKDLRKRLLFTLMILAIYRIGVVIPVPGVNATMLQGLAAKNAFVGLLNTFSGGALTKFSIMSMSIYPYVTASIIVQLLSMGVIRRWEEWTKEGEQGQAKITQWTRYLTVGLGLLQSAALTFSFSRELGNGFITDPSLITYIIIGLTLTAGTTFLMWLGEQITDKGVGNGVSVIIFVSILSQLEQIIPVVYSNIFVAHPNSLLLNIIKVAIILVAIIAMIIFIIFVQQGVRKIPVQYTAKQLGNAMYGAQNSHLPIKVNAAGMIPVIFASSLLFLPTIIGQFFPGNPVADWVTTTFSPTSWVYAALEFLLIVAFTFFYTFVQLNPSQLAEQLQKNSGYITGVRPGKPTEEYLVRVMNRLSLVSGVFLGLVAVLPLAFVWMTGLTGVSYYFSGTSLLIVIGVALDTLRQLEGQRLNRSYKGFIR